MSNQSVTRKDGRKLYYDHPVRPEELIETLDPAEIPGRAITCGGYRGPVEEAWMFD